jgi:peptidoglycan-N-acetylglucosamine deacetylase
MAGQGQTGSRVALTFDDGPHAVYTDRALDVLSAHRAPATFFCLGFLVERHPALVARMHRDGHLVANHGFDHRLAGFFRSPAHAYRGIVKCGLSIRAITGYFPRFYRPPVGLRTPPRVLSAHRLGLVWADWSCRAGDGGNGCLTPGKAKQLLAAVQGGDVILLHDGRIGRTGAALDEAGVLADEFSAGLATLLRGLHEKGLEPVRLDVLSGMSPGLNGLLDVEPEVSSWRLIQSLLRSPGGLAATSGGRS